MEAAGFYPAACRFVDAELVQCLKIISDGPLSSASDLDKAAVTGLVHGRMETVLQLAEILQSLCAESVYDSPGGALYEKILRQTRFSETQKRQLRNCLRRLALLVPQGDETMTALAGAQSAAQILRRLEARLSAASRDRGHG